MKTAIWERNGTVAVVTMTRGENRHNLAFARHMCGTFDEILGDPAVTSVVLTSSDACYWSVGVDVDWVAERLSEGDQGSVREFLYALNELFKTMLVYPLPVIAAINGHVAANGLVLACACDFRFMRKDRGFARFPEVDLGIPFLPGMIEITAKAVPRHLFEELKYTGIRMTAAVLEEHHVITKACDTEEHLLEEVFRFARSMNKNRAVFGEMKRRMNRTIIRVIDEEDPPFIEGGKLWYQ
ncbi:MAG: enoyl-CoA hydratase/isomerase family protein [Deltaproteobacteria bacterium]|nr:enoyl-CoA hydratase/isomerase family protein [Deltaproteobacteria bacterium]